jgi:hypothetical protein
MVQEIEDDLASRFAIAAAKALVRQLGFDAAYRQVAQQASNADDDERQMYQDILVALKQISDTEDPQTAAE